MAHALYFARINGTFAVFVGTTDSDPEDQIPGLLQAPTPDQVVWLSTKTTDELEAAKATLTRWFNASQGSAPPLEDRTAIQIDYP